MPKTNTKTVKENIERVTRDENGLLPNVDYKFLENGYIDWKSMIPNEYIVVNEEYFKKRNIDIPQSTEGLEDNQLIVKLGGLKRLAKIRGLVSDIKRVDESSMTRAVISCTLRFIPNYETGGEYLTKTEQANATIYNVNPSFQVFLETIAGNRSFTRAVRNALDIDIVGDSELASQKNEGNSGISPWDALKDEVKKKRGITNFDEFKKLVSKKSPEAEQWEDWKDIPINKIWEFLKMLGDIKS